MNKVFAIVGKQEVAIPWPICIPLGKPCSTCSYQKVERIVGFFETQEAATQFIEKNRLKTGIKYSSHVKKFLDLKRPPASGDHGFFLTKLSFDEHSALKNFSDAEIKVIASLEE